MDERIALKNGTIIDNKYVLQNEIGRGGSCIVYAGIYKDSSGHCHNVRIKELYPYCLKCERNGNDLVILENQQTDWFSEREAFFLAYENNLKIFSDKQLTNSTVEARDIIEENNTLYIIYSCDEGITLDKYEPSSLKECFQITVAIVTAIRRYHELGYLHLDIKPSNVFLLNGTREIVQLFDFDSLCSKNDIKEGKLSHISFSSGFAAPEQIEFRLDKISELTDLYAISATLYYILFNSVPGYEQRKYDAKYDFSKLVFSIDECDDLFWDELDAFFRRTLIANPRARYQSMDLVIDKLSILIYLSEPMSDAQISVLLSQVENGFEKNQIDKIMNTLEMLASKGNGRAMYYLTEIYGCGYGHIKQDDEVSRAWREKGSQTDDALAVFNGTYLSDDIEDRIEKQKYLLGRLEDLYNHGNNSAGYELAMYYYQNNSESIDMLKEIADKGFWRAINKLGSIVEETNLEEAMNYYFKASRLGVGDASYSLGRLFENNLNIQDYEKAVKYYKLSCDQGYASGANSVGFMIFKGTYAASSEEKAEWYRKAYELGDTCTAAWNLSQCYENGDGFPQNKQKAYELCRIAADNEQRFAMTHIGLLEKKNGNYAEALLWLTMASEKDDPNALNALGNMYYSGEGVNADIKRAIELYEKAANGGNKWAAYQLGCIYHEGEMYNVEKSKQWLQIAAEKHIDMAIVNLKRWYNVGDGFSYINGVLRSASYNRGANLSDQVFKDVKEYCDLYISMHGLRFFRSSNGLRIALGISKLDEIIIAYDNSVLHIGKYGFAVTTEGIYCRDIYDIKTHFTPFIEFVNESIEKKGTHIYAGKHKIASCRNEKVLNDIEYLFRVIWTNLVELE